MVKVLEEKLEVKVLEEKLVVKVLKEEAVGVQVENSNPEGCKSRKWPFSKLKSVRSGKSVMKGCKAEVKGGADVNRPQVCDGGDRARALVEAGAGRRDCAGDQLGCCHGSRGKAGDQHLSQTKPGTGWTLQETKAYWSSPE